MMSQMSLLPSIAIDHIVSGLSGPSDIVNCATTCKKWRQLFWPRLWNHVHIQMISWGSNHTNTHPKPFHHGGCRDRAFAYEHRCLQHRIVIDGNSIRDVCLQIYRNDLQACLANVTTLSVDLPLLIPEPQSNPRRKQELVNANYITLCHWLVKKLSSKTLPNLKCLEVFTLELMELFEIPILRNFLLKFPHVSLKIFAIITEQEIIPRLNYGINFENLSVLRVECAVLEDCVALCGNNPLSDCVERFELYTEKGSIDGTKLKDFLLEARSLKEIALRGDILSEKPVVWLPRSVEILHITEVNPNPKIFVTRMVAAGLVSLHVDVINGHTFNHINAPNLRRLKVYFNNATTKWTQGLNEAVASLLQASPALHRLEFRSVPFQDVSRLVRIHSHQIDSLVLSGDSNRQALVEIAAVCANLDTLAVDTSPYSYDTLITFLTEVLRHSSSISQILCKFQGGTLLPDWILVPSTRVINDGYSQIELHGPYYYMNIPNFKNQFKVRSGLELTMQLLQEKLALKSPPSSSTT